MDNLSEILKREAVERNLCDKWTAEWANDSDQQTLIDKYVTGIDFIIKQGEWPTNEFIKANFDQELLHDNLIFVDEDINLKDAPSGVYIFNGECSGTLRFEQWAAATIYVRHNSKIRIETDSFDKIFVRLYDNAEVDCDIDESAVVKVYDRRK